MDSKVIFKRSAVKGKQPTTAQLDKGELALNTADSKLFTKNEAGHIVELGGGVDTLSDLKDTLVTTPWDEDYLSYDGATKKWVNKTVKVHPIDDLSDVDTKTSPPTSEDVLVFDGTNWKNTSIVDLGSY